MHEGFDKLLELNSILVALFGVSIAAIWREIYKQVRKSRNEAAEQAKQAQESTEVRFQNLEYANVAILHDKLYKLCKEAIERGWIPLDDLENVQYLWRAYRGLGGNGTGEILYNKVLELRNTEKESEE